MPQRQGKHERERTLNWILKLKELQFFYIQRKLCLNRNRSKIFRWKEKHLVLKYNTYSDPRLEKSLSHSRIPTHHGLGNREIPFRGGVKGKETRTARWGIQCHHRSLHIEGIRCKQCRMKTYDSRVLTSLMLQNLKEKVQLHDAFLPSTSWHHYKKKINCQGSLEA